MGNSPVILDFRGKEINTPKKTKWVDDVIAPILFIVLWTTITVLCTILVNEVFFENECVCDQPTTNTFFYSDEWTGNASATSKFEYPPEIAPEIVTEGNCVDIASAILFMLGRKYNGLSTPQVAITFNHCQAVLDYNGQKTFLGLKDNSIVYKKGREFIDGVDLAYMDAKDFLDAAETIKPELTVVELLAFLCDAKRN